MCTGCPTLDCPLIPLLCTQVRCVQIAIDKPAARGEMRVFNQFTEQFRWRECVEAFGHRSLHVACCTRVFAGDGDGEVRSGSAVAEMVAMSSPFFPLPASTTWRASSDRRGRSWELTSR